MLVALLFLYDAAPGHSFAMADMAEGGRSLPLQTQLLIFAGFFIGFGVKMPVFPLHGWLPLAHVEAPSPVSILLSGVLLKMGAYGLIRAAETLPAALLAAAGLAGPARLHQPALRRHPGLAAAGSEGDGGLFVDLAHGHRAARHRHAQCHRPDRRRDADGGARFDRRAAFPDRRPALPAHAQSRPGRLRLTVGQVRHALLFSPPLRYWPPSVLPGSAGFIAELHALVGGFGRWGGWILIVCLGMLIAAAYSLRVIGRLCLPGAPMQLADMTRTESAAAALLALSILTLGLWPTPLLDLVAGSVGQLARLFGG
jgi:NADH-quinone oxidoreductase subunit M